MIVAAPALLLVGIALPLLTPGEGPALRAPGGSRRRSRRRRAALAVALAVGLACSRAPDPEDFRVGATRAEVLESFGPPAREQSLVKQDDAIWGPIEDFWSRVPRHGTVEIWSYRVEGGAVELYFVDGSDRVEGLGFAPAGAVFEADR